LKETPVLAVWRALFDDTAFEEHLEAAVRAELDAPAGADDPQAKEVADAHMLAMAKRVHAVAPELAAVIGDGVIFAIVAYLVEWGLARDAERPPVEVAESEAPDPELPEFPWLEHCQAHGLTHADHERRWAAAHQVVSKGGLARCLCCAGPISTDAPLICRVCGFADGRRDHSARDATPVRLTVRERDDHADIALLRRLRAILTEHPGGNRVVVTLRMPDGRRVDAEYAAVASRELRLALGRELARHARERWERWEQFTGAEKAG
jgi:hypothetical protein